LCLRVDAGSFCGLNLYRLRRWDKGGGRRKGGSRSYGGGGHGCGCFLGCW
jgi:hypothetical protein